MLSKYDLIRISGIILFLSFFSSCDKLPYDEEEIEKEGIYLFMNKNRHGSQGMSIFDGMIFVAYDGGDCDVYDFETKKRISSFSLDSPFYSSHCNCLNFDTSVCLDGMLPPLYVSNGRVSSYGEWQCQVQGIKMDSDNFSATLLQTITLDVSDFKENGLLIPWGAPQWLVDAEQGYLWVWSATLRSLDYITGDFANNRYHATKFRIPDLSEGEEVVLSASDVLGQVSFEFDAYATQGGCMSNGVIYYAYGLGTQSQPSKIRVYDTLTKTIIQKVDLGGVVDLELEDLCLYEGKLYINTVMDPIFVMSFPSDMLQ